MISVLLKRSWKLDFHPKPGDQLVLPDTVLLVDESAAPEVWGWKMKDDNNINNDNNDNNIKNNYDNNDGWWRWCVIRGNVGFLMGFANDLVDLWHFWLFTPVAPLHCLHCGSFEVWPDFLLLSPSGRWTLQSFPHHCTISAQDCLKFDSIVNFVFLCHSAMANLLHHFHHQQHLNNISLFRDDGGIGRSTNYDQSGWCQ